MGSSYSGILAFPHLISLGSSWKVKGGRKKGSVEGGSVIFVARWKQTREDGGKEKQENSWEVWWGASISLAAFSCLRIETNPAQNEPLSSATLGGMLDMKRRQLTLEKLVKLFYSRREKKNCETLLTDGKSGCFFFFFPKFHFGHFTVCHSPCQCWSERRQSAAYVLSPIICRGWL